MTASIFMWDGWLLLIGIFIGGFFGMLATVLLGVTSTSTAFDEGRTLGYQEALRDNETVVGDLRAELAHTRLQADFGDLVQFPRKGDVA